MDASPLPTPGAASAMSSALRQDRLAWLLLLLAGALAPFSWAARGHPPSPGSIIDASLTLITADKHDLHCAFSAEVQGRHCAFRAPGLAFTQDPSRVGVLQPFVTLEGVMFLVSDLFAQRALAQRYALELPDGRPRPSYRRFVAHCRVKLLQRVKGALVQFGTGTSWGPAPPLWVAEPVSCLVSG
jgi:hypothetical protein